LVDLALLQSVSYIAGALGVCVAAVYYVMNLRISQRNQELTLQALEQSATSQELSLKTQGLALKAQEQNLETRQAQLFMQLFDRFSGSEFALNYGKVRYEILPKLNNSPEELNKFIYQNTNEKFNPDVFLPFHQLTLFFDGVGVLVQKDLVNIDLVERLFSDRIIWFWTMIKPRIVFSRESQGPQLYANIEWLYDEMVRRQGIPAVP
jgi:hypothetical protein